MGLIKCAECNAQVSEKALLCPKCGAPVSKQEKFRHETSSKTQEGKRFPIWKIVLPVAILAVVTIVVVMLQNNPNSIPGIKIEVNTPSPVVVTKRADDANSELLKIKTTVYTTIQNQGGAGNVLVTFHVYQGDNDYARSKSIDMQANENIDISETFSEVTRLGGDITYNVEARAE